MAAGAGGAGDVPAGHVLGGWGSGLNFNWEGVFGLNLPGYINIADLGLPVGLGGIPVFEPWFGIPTLDADNSAQTDIPPAIDRRDITSDQTELPVVAEQTGWYKAEVVPITVGAGEDKMPFYANVGTLTPQEVLELEDLGYQVVFVTADNGFEEEDDVSWIDDIYTTVDAALGGWLPGGAPVGSSIPQIGFGQPTTQPQAPPVVINQGGGGPPLPPGGFPVQASCGDNDPMKGMVLKKYCGEWRWIKSKNRRRKQLVTQTDLKGLAALKGVLGGGKAFEVWIATHS